MAVSAYRYAGAHLAQAASNWDVQKQNLGILELNIDQLVPGAREILILSLQQFTIPGREVQTQELPYLNGKVGYPSSVQKRANIQVTFRDFPQTGARSILQRWFQLVYDEETGLMLPSGLIKSTGYLVLFQSNGVQERHARLEGLFPTKEPEIAIDFSQGDHMTMATELNCDRLIWESSLANPIG